MKKIRYQKKLGALALSAFFATAAASHAAAVITPFSGVGDLDFNADSYVYAANLGGTWNAADVIVQNATFVQDYATAGVTLTTGGILINSPYYEIAPIYGDGSSLNLVTHGLVGAWGTGALVNLSMAVTSGQQYELKMLFSENYYKDATANARMFDISVEETLIADEFTPMPIGSTWVDNPHMGVQVAYQFTAGDNLLNIDLTRATGGDGSVLISGFTLEAIPEPSSFALIGGLLALGSVMMRRRSV